jgi:hypothetical protein
LIEDVQEAIEESSTKAGQARYAVVFGYNGASTPLRYLDLFSNVTSNTSPYVIAEATELISISVSFLTSITSATFDVYRNGVSVASLTVNNSNRGYTVLSPVIALSAGDEISASHTSGNNVSDIILATLFKVPF